MFHVKHYFPEMRHRKMFHVKHSGAENERSEKWERL